MRVQEIEAEALKLSEGERGDLVRRLLASLGHEPAPTADDPIFGLGSTPISTGVLDGAAQHDHYLYGAAKR